MNPKEELFEKFGQQLIQKVRDNQIRYMDSFLEQKAPLSNKYKGELDEMSPSQMKMVKDIVVDMVDGTLHDLLFLLEDSKWIKLRLEGNNTVLEDIREVERGDLQGYIFIWAEKYSTTRRTDFTNK